MLYVYRTALLLLSIHHSRQWYSGGIELYIKRLLMHLVFCCVALCASGAAACGRPANRGRDESDRTGQDKTRQDAATAIQGLKKGKCLAYFTDKPIWYGSEGEERRQSGEFGSPAGPFTITALRTAPLSALLSLPTPPLRSLPIARPAVFAPPPLRRRLCSGS